MDMITMNVISHKVLTSTTRHLLFSRGTELTAFDDGRCCEAAATSKADETETAAAAAAAAAVDDAAAAGGGGADIAC